MMEEFKLAQSKIRKLTVAITANQHIFQFQVPENQRNIPCASYYSTSEYYNTVPTLRWAQSSTIHYNVLKLLMTACFTALLHIPIAKPQKDEDASLLDCYAVSSDATLTKVS